VHTEEYLGGSDCIICLKGGGESDGVSKIMH